MIITTPFIVIITLLFVAVFLFARTIDKRVWVSGLLSIVLTPLIYFYVLYPLINIFSDYHHQKYFNAETWKTTPALRYEMGNDLKASKMLIGKNKAEVTALLGAPEWFSWNDAIKANDSNYWNYNLGMKPGAFNTKQECIKLRFVNNRAEQLEQYQLEQNFDD